MQQVHEPPAEATDQPLLEARGLNMRFGKQHVLRDINLQIPRGHTLVIIGESGCGKTVLLKSLIGLARPTSGEILFDGQNLHTLGDKELTKLRTRFGFLFQGAALFDSMTVAQNVAFPLKEHTKKSDAEVRQIVMERLAEVGLPDTIVTKKPAELSGGMRKRVGLARALTLNPEVMLYDEPTTGLDPIMSDIINELILRTRSRYPVTNIVVTHDMHTVRKVADRVVMLTPLSRVESSDSQILYDGPADQLERSKDQRVTQFVKGEARERLMEMRAKLADMTPSPTGRGPG